MKRIFLKKCLIIGIAIGIILLLSTTSNAALAITTSKSSVEPGETFNVTVSVSSNEAGAVTLSATNATLSKTSIDLMTQSSVIVSCIAGNSGIISINASGTVANYETETENSQSASKSVTIVVPEPEPTPEPTPDPEPVVPVKSSNANLKNLGITPHDFSGFKSGTTSYNVSVPNETEGVNVYAYKEDEKATVSGTGYKSLNVGENKLEVVVIAEDGTTKTYTINVTRKEEAEEEEEKKSNNANLKELVVKPEGLTPEFDKDITSYTLVVGKDIEKIEVLAKAEDEKATYKIIGNTDLKEDENIIKIVVTAEDGTTKTYEIKVTKSAELHITDLEIKATGTNNEKVEIKINPALSASITEYKLSAERFIEKLDITAKASDEKAIVEVIGNTDLKMGENIITIIVKSKDEKETKTYQLILNNVENKIVPINVEEEVDNNRTIKMVIFVLCVLGIVGLGIYYAVVEYNYQKNRENTDTVDFINDNDFLEADEIFKKKPNNEDDEEPKSKGKHF